MTSENPTTEPSFAPNKPNFMQISVYGANYVKLRSRFFIANTFTLPSSGRHLEWRITENGWHILGNIYYIIQA